MSNEEKATLTTTASIPVVDDQNALTAGPCGPLLEPCSSTTISIYNPMAHLGLVIVPTGYADPAMLKTGTPYGASSVSQNKTLPPTADDLELARFQGRRVAAVAKALKNAATRAHADQTDGGHLGDEQMMAGWRWLCPTTH
jgi:multimeric flavodoxin WrbA